MSEPHYDDQQHVVLDGVDDAVVPDPDTESRTPLQGSRARWPRILGQQCDGAVDSSPNVGIELAERTGCGGTKLDAVGAHSQPRSALTCSHGMFGPSSAIAASKATTSSASSRAAISCS